NKHVGDWDSTVQIFLNKDKTKGFIMTSMHGQNWLMKIPRVTESTSLNEWISRWEKNPNGKNGLNKIYTFMGHPFVFVANGAHGCYPTPGYTVWGYEGKIVLKGLELPVATDERQIGKICLMPKNGGIKKSDIKRLLKDELNINIKDKNIKEYDIETPTVFPNFPNKEPKERPWLYYEGSWGNNSRYQGWSGPTSKFVTASRAISLNRVLKVIKNSKSKNAYDPHFKKLIDIIIRNYHGF
ncbi:MAG: hypothetical protein ACE5H1_08935, partial [Thermodesulfobacteriota bacterium]